jgi:hypothetical protein
MGAGASIRVRFVVVIVILTGAAIAAGLMTFNRLRASHQEQATQTPLTQTPALHGAKKPSKPGPVESSTTATPTTPTTPTTAASPPPPAAPKTATAGLPAEVARQLAANHVVVVSLFAPKAKIDATAMREASAGAALAGAAFVGVDVTGSEIDGLNRRYGVLQDPAVLVLRPPGDLIVRIDGFADRDTVAQAAANASS